MRTTQMPVINEYDTMIIEGMPYICYDGTISQIGKDEGGIYYKSANKRDIPVYRENEELYEAVISGLRRWENYCNKIDELEEAEANEKKMINKEVDNIIREAIGKEKMDEIKQKANSLLKFGSGIFNEIYNEIMPMIDEQLKKAEQ